MPSSLDQGSYSFTARYGKSQGPGPLVFWGPTLRFSHYGAISSWSSTQASSTAKHFGFLEISLVIAMDGMFEEPDQTFSGLKIYA